MENKKGRKKKVKFNYFMKRKIVLGICLLLVFVGGVVTVLALTDKDEEIVEKPKVDNTIPAECPYTLEELEEAVTTNWLFHGDAYGRYREDAEEVAFILLDFYKYFSKDTEFIVWDEINRNNHEPISFKKISYEQYQANIQHTRDACSFALENGGSKWICIIDLRLFMMHDAKFVDGPKN